MMKYNETTSMRENNKSNIPAVLIIYKLHFKNYKKLE